MLICSLCYITGSIGQCNVVVGEKVPHSSEYSKGQERKRSCKVSSLPLRSLFVSSSKCPNKEHFFGETAPKCVIHHIKITKMHKRCRVLQEGSGSWCSCKETIGGKAFTACFQRGQSKQSLNTSAFGCGLTKIV